MTAVLFPGKSHGQRNLRYYSPKDCKRVRHDLITKKQEQKEASPLFQATSIPTSGSLILLRIHQEIILPIEICLHTLTLKKCKTKDPPRNNTPY